MHTTEFFRFARLAEKGTRMEGFASPEVVTAIGIGILVALVWGIAGAAKEVERNVGRSHDRLSEIVERLDALDSRLEDIDGRLIMMEPDRRRLPPGGYFEGE